MLTIAVAPAVAALFGCARGDEAPPVALYPVRGSVTVDGRPAAGAVVYFHPVEANPWPRPHAQADADGRFVLSTFRFGDGAPAGQYRATVSWKIAEDESGAPLTHEDRDEGEEIIPKEYLQAETTPWVIEVRPGDNTLDPLEL